MNAKFRIHLKRLKLVPGEIAVISNIQLLSLASPRIAYLGFEADFLTCRIGLGLPHFCQLPSDGLGHIGKVEVGLFWRKRDPLM